MSNPFQEQKLNRNYFSSNLILNKFSRISNDFNDLTTFNIIVVDDEILTRLSTIRTLKIIFKTLNLNVNIIEAEDGIETIFYVYKSCCNGYKISLILSDENMNFMNGIRSSAIIKEILNKKKMGEIPFYLVTAYDSSVIDKSESCNVTKILEKPLNSKIASKILKNLFIP